MPLRYWLALTSLLVTTAAAAPDLKHEKFCSDVIRKLPPGYIGNMEARPGWLHVYVGPRFIGATFQQKQAIAQSISCIIVRGDPKELTEISFRHWQSGQELVRYHYGRLEAP